jgi:hypothetical protein
MRGSYTTLLVICPFYSLYLYHIPCMFRLVDICHGIGSGILLICTSLMSNDPNGWCSVQWIRVLLTSVGMVSGLVKYC